MNKILQSASFSNGVNVTLFLVDFLKELILKCLGWYGLAVLLNCVLKFAVDLQLS